MDTFVKKTLKVSTIKKCINLVKDRWADTLRHLQHGGKPIPATWRQKTQKPQTSEPVSF